jgi:hypothetical protein
MIEFQAPWTSVTMFLVPHARFIPGLVERGIPRGRMWLAEEVRDLIHAQVTRDALVSIVEAKLVLDGFVLGAERKVA